MAGSETYVTNILQGEADEDINSADSAADDYVEPGHASEDYWETGREYEEQDIEEEEDDGRENAENDDGEDGEEDEGTLEPTARGEGEGTSELEHLNWFKQ